MKIAVLTPFYDPSVGGVQETMRVFAEYFASNGCQVAVFTSQCLGIDQASRRFFRSVHPLHPVQTRSHVEVHRFPYGGLGDGMRQIFSRVGYKFGEPFRSITHDWHISNLLRLSQMEREIILYQPDVLLVSPGTAGLMRTASAVKKKLKCKVAVHPALHLSDTYSLDGARVTGALRVADLLLVNTDYEKQYIASRGIQAPAIWPTAVGIDVDHFTAPLMQKPDQRVLNRLEGKRYVLFFGRKEGGKGVAALLEAFRRVRRDYPEAHLVLAGQETDFYRSKVIPQLEGKTYAHSLGDVDFATKKWLYENAVVFCMVSSVDSFGIVYCESWLSRRPVIAADTAQMRGVVEPGVDGYLVDAADTDALAEKIMIFLSDSDLAARMGEAGYKKVLNYFGGHAVEKKVLELLSTMV